MPMNLFRRRPSDLMSDPRMDALREKALNRTSEDSMRAYGGGTGTSGVPVGTIMVEEPGAATRAMSGVGVPGAPIVRTIDQIPVQPSDKRWDPAQVQTFMGEASPEGMAQAVGTGSVAERLLGAPSTRGFETASTGQPSSTGLFYDENHFQTSANKDKRFNDLQSDYWIRNLFTPARAQRTTFANLDDYDQWFRSIPNGKPGEFGDVMKQAYVDGMPPNIADEWVERKNQIVTNRKEAGVAKAFTDASGVSVQNAAEAKAVLEGTNVKRDLAAMKPDEQFQPAVTPFIDPATKQPVANVFTMTNSKGSASIVDLRTKDRIVKTLSDMDDADILDSIKKFSPKPASPSEQMLGAALGTPVQGEMDSPELKAARELFVNEATKRGLIPKLSAADKQALDWANANPTDPRAAKIKAKLGR